MTSGKLTRIARKLRHDSTDAERKLWSRLRNRQLMNLKFVRQETIGLYVTDFCCRSRRLIIELDGGHHAEQIDADTERTRALEAQGYVVLRFWNHDVLTNIDSVLETIIGHLKDSGSMLD